MSDRNTDNGKKTSIGNIIVTGLVLIGIAYVASILLSPTKKNSKAAKKGGSLKGDKYCSSSNATRSANRAS